MEDELFVDFEDCCHCEEVKEKKYSLKLEDYTGKKEEKIKKGWVKLGDIVEFEKGKALKIDQIIMITNKKYKNVRHIGNIELKCPDIGEEYIYLQWGDDVWYENYYVNKNRFL